MIIMIYLRKNYNTALWLGNLKFIQSMMVIPQNLFCGITNVKRLLSMLKVRPIRRLYKVRFRLLFIVIEIWILKANG